MSWVMSINPWATLVVAGLLEVLWASGLKNVGVSRPWTSLGVLIALAGSMILIVLTAMPAFFVDVPAFVKAIVAASVVWAVASLVLAYSGVGEER